LPLALAKGSVFLAKAYLLHSTIPLAKAKGNSYNHQNYKLSFNQLPLALAKGVWVSISTMVGKPSFELVVYGIYGK